MNTLVYKGRVWSHWSTAQSTTPSGYRQLSLLETAVLVSAGSFRWLLLPIWPQPHRPSDYSQLSSREWKRSWTASLRICWRLGAIPCLGRRHLNPPNKQSLWDRPLVELDKADVRRSATGLVDRARLDAACSPYSADWLSALPIAACGLTLDNEAVRVAVGLRLGQDLCAPHSCICGELVGQDGHHRFVCRKAQGRALRHHTINDVLWRALNRAGVPSTREI